MLYTIESANLKVTVNSMGAELYSVICKKTNTELLWQGEAPFWGRRSPVLFPMVGRSKNNMYSCNGQQFEMGGHGFARDNEFAVTTEPNRLIFALKDSSDLRQVYPFAFLLEVIFTLDGNCLKTEYKITNPSDSENLIFAVGAHPGFNCQNITNYYLEFDGMDALTCVKITDDGLMSNETFQLCLQNGKLPLSYDLFEKYLTLVLVDTDVKKVVLKSVKNPITITMAFDAQHFGVWTQPGAPFICLEPWDGLPDYEDFDGDYVNKLGNHILPPGGVKSFRHSICVN